MQLGEIYKYLPTSTVGKVLALRDRGGKSWALLDFTELWYDASLLVPADASEYKEIKFKYRKSNPHDNVRSIRDLIKEKEDVDISGFTPSGGG
ncbi:MAG: DUF2098 domain-containing protein [archaeon]|nr:DUF2098 domain-containing protein [archaeon]